MNERKFTCRKCSNKHIAVKFSRVKDSLDCVCSRCGYQWDEWPQDKIREEAVMTGLQKLATTA